MSELQGIVRLDPKSTDGEGSATTVKVSENFAQPEISAETTYCPALTLTNESTLKEVDVATSNH